MSDVAIKVENLHKLYRLGVKEDINDSLVSTCLSWLKAPKKNFQQLRKLSHIELNSHEDDVLHALNDISFEVQRGEVLGVIGRNGAGKSTLLKVLSRITEPSAGRVTINGRVASLLEVGTGFHPELSGRDNVYMNGTILGMTKKEIDKKFDEIVDFSGVEKFLDTPVKRYSSGMKVRLAFAVAAHLEPEILIIDEVLAVGDAAFQKKCIGKMEQVATGGRTILFVSHNMATIQMLCSRGIFLVDGKVSLDSSANEVVNKYLSELGEVSKVELSYRKDRTGQGDIKLTSVDIYNKNEDQSANLITGKSAIFKFNISEFRPNSVCNFTIYDNLGNAIINLNSSYKGRYDKDIKKEDKCFIAEFDELLLRPGRYRVNASLSSAGVLQDHLEAATFFNVEQGILDGRVVNSIDGFGSVYMHHRWCSPV